MPNIFPFPEDMLPRKYPKIKQQQLKENSVIVPTLPSVSLILDDENEGFAQPPAALTKLKQHDESSPIEHPTKYETCREKRQTSYDRSTRQDVRPKLELTFCTPSVLAKENNCNLKQDRESRMCEKQTSCINKETLSGAFFSVHVGQQQLQKPTMVQINEDFQVNQEHSKVINQQGTYGCQNECVSGQRKQQSLAEQQNVGIKQKQIRNSKEKVTDETLAGIVEDQKQHILIQQKQLWLQQKQNLMQQNQIFALQQKIQQLLEKENIQNKSKSIVYEQTKTASLILDEFKIPSYSKKTLGSGSQVRKSVGVVTSSSQLNEAKYGNLKFMEKSESKFEQKNVRVTSSAEAIQSKCDVRKFPKIKYASSRHCDINITAQTLIYEAPSTNSGYVPSYMNESQDADCSVDSFMQEMNFGPQGKLSLNTDQPIRDLTNTNNNDQLSVTMSPDAYDYLFRHRLLEDMNNVDEHFDYI